MNMQTPKGFTTYRVASNETLIFPTGEENSGKVIASSPFDAYLRKTVRIDQTIGFKITPREEGDTETSFSLSVREGQGFLLGTPRGVLTIKPNFNARVGVKTKDYVPYLGEDRLFTNSPTQIEKFYNGLAFMHLKQAPLENTVKWIKDQGLGTQLQTQILGLIENEGVKNSLTKLYDMLAIQAAERKRNGAHLKA